MNQARAYTLDKGDILSIDLNPFMHSSIFWNNPFQILKFDKHKRKWWKIWKPKYTYFVKIDFFGYEVK